MTIRILSDETINKIAAGEVIENPASVVKELVENALDAGSTEIRVVLKGGGFSLIRVSDNGCGMSQDMLLLSLERHATSKIQEAKDLDQILTMGFRGEALASIAAISKMKMTSAADGNKGGAALISEGGRIRGISPAAHPQGTTVEVSSLFYSVPARRKFQKSPAAALSDVTRFLTKFALSHPMIQLHFIADEKELFHVPAGTIQERADKILGKDFLAHSTKMSFQEGEFAIEGYLGSSLHGRSNRLGQYLFVNKRAVSSPQLVRAICEGYGTRLPARLHPTFILHFSLPPDWIDVNVHPQKKEIRLREEQKIFSLTQQSVMEAFKGNAPSFKSYPPQEFTKTSWDFEPSLMFQEKREPPPPFFEPFQEEFTPLCIFSSYLLVQGPSIFHPPQQKGPFEGLFFIDLKGAYARVLFERYLTQKSPSLQSLSFPLTLEFSRSEAMVLEQNLERIKSMGIELRVFGNHSFIVDALDPELKQEDVKGFLEEYIFAHDESLVEKKRQKKLALSLSTYARSKKKGYSLVEAKQLVKELMKTSSPYDCPLGNPTMIHLSHDAVKNFFQRPPQ